MVSKPEKILEIKFKLFRKPNGSPAISYHFEGDDSLLRAQDIGMIIAELEKAKNEFVGLMKSDAEVMEYDINDEVVDESKNGNYEEEDEP